MKMRILLTGKSGQIGHDLALLLPRLGESVAMDRTSLDLADSTALRRVVRDLRPDLIVNAAAYTAVDKAESEPALAHAVNAGAPAVLAEEAKRLGAVLVHFSTGYVFDGAKRSPYLETDPTAPLNVYGKTKLAGEQAILNIAPAYLLFRTSWVYATRGRNFLLTILRLATEREELRIVNDQVGAPTSSAAIASATVKILQRIFDAKPVTSRFADFTGIYHLTAAGETSWHGFAQAILEECSRPNLLGPWYRSATAGRPLVACRLLPIATADYPTPTQRPLYSVLSNAKLQHVFRFHLPDWRTALSQALRPSQGCQNQ
jgi:dTDP-4-dehydrorhamnose reductase